MKIKFLWVLLILVLPISGYSQQEETVELSNGLKLTTVPIPGSGLVSVVLVCHKPADMDSSETADTALINTLLWKGGTVGNSRIDEYEYHMFVRRFGGRIGSQHLSDGLTIQYTMPAGLLSEILRHLQAQWSDLTIDPGQLNIAKSTLAENEQNALLASVHDQLIYEVQKRLWSDLQYSSPSYGSIAALEESGENTIRRTFSLLRNPANWELFVVGNLADTDVRTLVENTLGTITAGEMPPREPLPRRAAARLGLTLRLPVDLADKNAVAAYRFDEPDVVQRASLLLLGEALPESAAIAGIRNLLGERSIRVGADIRTSSSMFFVMLKWDTGTAPDAALEKLYAVLENLSADSLEDTVIDRARNRLLTQYYQRRQSAHTYALWRGMLASTGVSTDDFAETLQKLDNNALREFARNLLVKEKRIALMTVDQ